MSRELPLGGEVRLRRRPVAGELRKRHERRGWLLPLDRAAIVVGVAGLREPGVREELLAVLEDLERAERGCPGGLGVREAVSRIERRDPSDEPRVGA